MSRRRRRAQAVAWCAGLALWFLANIGVALSGCAVSHERQEPRDGPVSVRDLGTAPTSGSADGGPQGGDGGQGEPLCGDMAAEGCVPALEVPQIGEDVYCPAEHDWIPALADRWGVTRYVAHDRCSSWWVCPGIGRACFHCADAGDGWAVWTGGWCGD